MLIGLPGSGKDTWLKQFIRNSDEPFEIVSSDDIRQELYGSAAEQGDPKEIFGLVNKRIKSYLIRNKNIIYNATNIKVKDRRGIMELVKPHKDIMKYAIIIGTTYEQCLINNKNRAKNGGRFVPEQVIKRMYYNYEPPHYFEGFNKIEVVYPFIKPYITPSDILKRLRKIPHDNPHHRLSIGTHIKATAKAAEKDIKKGLFILDENDEYRQYYTSLIPKVLWLHDLGKEKTKVFEDKKGNPTEIAHYWGHSNVGAYDYMFYVNKNEYNPFKPTYDPNIAAAICYHDKPYQWTKQKTFDKYKKLWGNRLYNLILKIHYYDSLEDLK